MSIRFGYGTNGLTNHRIDDALAVVADLGYEGVALTLDHAHLDPFADDLTAQVTRVRRLLDRHSLGVVVETGARYLLDARRKHHPTLVSTDPADVAVRVDFLRRAVRIAADLGAEAVSFWSGVLSATAARDAGIDAALDRLGDGVAQVLETAAESGVPLAMEPEPGHLVETLDDVFALRARLGDPELLKITIDVGHCVAVEPTSAAECVRRAGSLLVNVQLDDMRRGVHEHLEFGEGELDLVDTLGALHDVGYRGLAAVELPRHAHAGPDVAARSITALRAAEWTATGVAAVRADATAIRALFPAAGRSAGRTPVRASTDPTGVLHGTLDDAARARLLAALPADAVAAEVADLYRYGDDAERRGVLRGLPGVDGALPVDDGLALVRDALRSNDTRLVAAALGPYAAAHLDDHGWRHGVLKCLFVGVPLAAVAGLRDRADDELRRMVGDFAAERRAAGRAVPDDATRLLEGR